jgi:formyl-CoA transferase
VGIDPNEERFKDNPTRVRNVDELGLLIEERLQARTVDEWIATFDELDVPVGRVRSIDEVYEWEQVRAMELIVEVEHPTLGKIRLPGAPLTFSRTVPECRAAPPTLGQHQALVKPAVPVDLG